MDVRSGTLESLIDSARAAEQSGDWESALERYEHAFMAVRSGEQPGLAADLLSWTARVRLELGELRLARDLLYASLAIAEAQQLSERVATALSWLANVEQRRGQLDVAESHYSRALLIGAERGDDRFSAVLQQNLGTLASARGDLETALLRYRFAFERLRQLGDRRESARALNNIGASQIEFARWEAAETALAEAWRLTDRPSEADIRAAVELNRAELYLRREWYELARSSCDRAFAIFHRLGSIRGQAEAYKFYGAIYREMGDPHLAEIHLALALRLANACQDRVLEAEMQSEWAMVHLAAGRTGDAIRSVNRAHYLFSDLGANGEILDVERQHDRLRQVYVRTAEQWSADRAESGDRYAAGHCRRIAEYSCALARALGYGGWDLDWLRVGAFLHDAGTTSTPRQLLEKQDRLIPAERQVVRKQPLVGDEIVGGLDLPFDVRSAVRSLREHWDGSGHPDGLRGNEIPLSARILAVADVFDALTTERSYRGAYSVVQAFDIMANLSGTVLDPTLFVAFRRVVEIGAVEIGSGPWSVDQPRPSMPICRSLRHDALAAHSPADA